MFVIQKHAARRLHYDFRLEAGGVLKSWAVPKRIPTQKGDKRLAMQVEDHPLDYADFEGIIPVGNYGAGSVMVWDTGHYDAVGGDAESALRAGKLVVRLKGKKLNGEWTLIRMRHSDQRSENAWLLIKTGENMRPLSLRADDRSVHSGRSMKQIAATARKTWLSNRAAQSSAKKKPRTSQPTRNVQGR